ncbi:carbohydrate ABC transporter permease [Mesorhizobium sp. CAU 1732]|uniref:carbohydrate ABC transporter permease n=1 Tax=Mesorhizobium sp. CAU 1732 TaxID=3140358 RepID=UPI00326120D3
MRSFPREVLEAARMDGAKSWRILWEVMVPNLRGTIASLAILIFISTWNEYFWPLLLSRTPENSVIQIGIQMFMTSEGTMWGPLMAAATMASAPVLVIYIFLQRQVVQSFMKSGIR